jgi:hypothetical protein
MKKARKKFDRGGSVMDKPSRDMRDPRYRKQLEREQALETSAPESMLIGPGGAASGFRFLKPAAKPTGAIPEVGSRLPEAVLKGHTDYYSKLAGGKLSKESIEGLAKQATAAELRQAKQQAQALKGTAAERRAKKVRAVAETTASSAARPIGIEYLTQRGEGKKAGGAVKSASKRGDGIAQRGKTKGRMV